MRQLRLLLLWIGVAAAPLFAQAQASSGDLRGTVTDPGGAAISQAKVRASDPAHGVQRSTTTDAAGEYRIPLLPPGTYQVRVEAAGFTSKVLDGVVIRVGDTVALRTQLEIGAVSSQVTVTAETPVIETERTQQATTIDSHRIENLPINRRNYLDFALLSPGVSETNDIVDGNDFRVAQTPQSGLSFGGGNGRGNAFTVDGAESYVTSGGVRPSASQEAVREFQINRSTFSAEFGGSLGGSVNIITKSGTNEVHGDVFGFLRQRDLQARNYFDPGKSAFTRGQYGATLGAPIRKDKTFLFTAYERLDRHETAFVPILQDRSVFNQLTPGQSALIDFFENGPFVGLKSTGQQLHDALLTSNYPATVQLFDANSGNFPFAETENQFSVRLDHQFSPTDFFFARGVFVNDDNQNAQLGALIAYNRGRNFRANDSSITLGNTRILGSKWVSETRLMFDYNKNSITPNDPYGPDVTITGYGSFGRELFLPSTTFERHFQFVQNFDYTSGRHSLKFGADINPVRVTARSETFFGGRFLFAQNIPLSALLNTASGDPNTSAQLAGLMSLAGRQDLVPYLDQNITALQAYNLGLPILYQQGFGDPNWTAWFRNYNFFVQDTFNLRPNFTLNLGARYELEGEPQGVNTDTNNLAPRIGFAWTPWKNGKTVLRGGYGIYYAPVNAQIANLPATLNGVRIAQVGITALGVPGLNNPLTGAPLTSFDVWQTLQQQNVLGTRTITKADIAQFGLVPGPNAPGRVLFGISPDYVNPYAQQASFEIEHAFGSYSLSAGYEFNRGARLPRELDQNLYYSGHTATGQPTYGFYDPQILQYNVLQSTANSFYDALIVQLSKRFSRHFTLNAHYTFSKSIDEVTDFNSDFEPNDQLNARAERALSSFDQRHRFVASGMFESPVAAGRGRGFWRNFLGGWGVAPIIVASSGRPFNLLTGYDNVGDNHPTTHRPYGAGRNIGLGPDYFTVDLRAGKRIPFGAEGRHNVEFIIEGFNLLNRTNFKNVNNMVGDLQLSDLPSPLVGQRADPILPLSFTSAFDPRQFQIGLKINY